MMPSSESYEKKLRDLESLIKKFLIIIGEDPERDGLKDTPRRVAKMWLDELAIGYRLNAFDHLKKFNLENGDDMYRRNGDIIIITDIPVRSMCEHHLLPIIGKASIAYIPNGYILGFSKFARIVDTLSRKLQIQERLTDQIADFIMENLKAKGVLVVIEAIHLCALQRGVKEPLRMITRSVRGLFKDDKSLKSEALALLFSNEKTHDRSSLIIDL
jgi:GTP cyclohydrolase I